MMDNDCETLISLYQQNIFKKIGTDDKELGIYLIGTGNLI